MVYDLRPRKGLTAVFSASKPISNPQTAKGITTQKVTEISVEVKEETMADGTTEEINQKVKEIEAAGNEKFEQKKSDHSAESTTKDEFKGDDTETLEDATPNVKAILDTDVHAVTTPGGPRKKRVRATKGFGFDPWPDYQRPTPEECAEVNRLLTEAHGPSERPEILTVDNTVSGCGEVPCVLDALLRTVLSLNTTTINSSRALQGLIARFGLIPVEEDERMASETITKKRKYTGKGVGSVNWNAVRLGSLKDLEESIKVGGMQVKKAQCIKGILDEVWKEGAGRNRVLAQQEADEKSPSKTKSPPTNYNMQKNLSDTDQSPPAKAESPVCDDHAQQTLSNDNDSSSELTDISGDGDEEEGELTLDYLHQMDNVELLNKLISYQGIGYKAASCVMLFCKCWSYAVYFFFPSQT
jgi:endonuclease III